MTLEAEALKPSPVGEQAAPFSVQYTAALLVNSFRFSQGSTRFHGPILEYLAVRFRDQFDIPVIKDARDPASRKAYKVINNSKLHNPNIRFNDTHKKLNPKEKYGEVRKLVRGYAGELIGYLGDEPDATAPEVDYLATETIDRDTHFLGLTEPKRMPPRRVRNWGTETSSRRDPYFSFWVYHGLMQQTTGFKEYDTMFEEMVAGFNATYSSGSVYRARSDALVANYAEHHPDTIIR